MGLSTFYAFAKRRKRVAEIIAEGITFRLPLQLGHSRNLIPAHPLQGRLEGLNGIPSKRFCSIPFSCSSTTSSAPPMYLPLMKSLGGTTLLPRILQSSSLYSRCIETSLSEYITRKLSSRNRIVLQSSNVFLIPRRVVVYTMMLSFPPSRHLS